MPIPFYASECQKIAELLQAGQYHDGHWGYVVYRCSYNNDDNWAKFMTQLTDTVHAILDEDEDGHLIKGSFAWNIRDDQTRFEGASKAEIREHFNQWVESLGVSRLCTRYEHCIYADEEVIDAVLNGKDPTAPRDPRPLAWVKLLDYQYEESPKQYSEDEVEDDDTRNMLNEGDEGFPPVEGCKRGDLGWMKMAIKVLVPRAYSLMQKGGWYIAYKRPPAIAED